MTLDCQHFPLRMALNQTSFPKGSVLGLQINPFNLIKDILKSSQGILGPLQNLKLRFQEMARNRKEQNSFRR